MEECGTKEELVEEKGEGYQVTTKEISVHVFSHPLFWSGEEGEKQAWEYQQVNQDVLQDV